MFSAATLSAVNRRYGVTSVAAFGARGDGLVDDTEAIQKAVDSITGKGALWFAPGKRYLISDTIDIDVSKVRAIIGNNAQIVVSEDVPAFHIQGSKTTGTALPSQNTVIATEELSPSISDLQVYSNQSPYKGVGFRIEGTFGLRITGCHLFRLVTGIELVNRNRNIIIQGNHIWDCLNYGIHYNGGNLHQNIIAENHISYLDKAIFVDEADVHNLHIVGNDIEGSGSSNLIHIKGTRGATVSQVQIASNSIEDHMENTGALLRVENATASGDTTAIMEIVGNEFSSSNTDAIEFSGDNATIKSVTITGNNFIGLNGFAVRINGRGPSGLVINNNTVDSLLSDRETGLAYFTTRTNVVANISNNVCKELRRAAVVIEGISSESGQRATLVNFHLTNNSFWMNKSGTSDDWVIDLSTNMVSIFNTTIRNNNIYLQNWSENGMRVASINTPIGLIIRENIIYGIAEGKTAYSLPNAVQDSVLVDDNLAVPVS